MNILIAISNAKGGVGKTTSAIHLATALSPKYDVEVWDADPQGSATTWAYAAADDEDSLPFECQSVNLSDIRRRKLTAELTILDTPPQNVAILDAASDRADVVIVPTAPTAGDLERVFSTLDAIPAGKPSIVLMTDADPRTVLYRETREALEGAGVAVFDQPIKPLQAIRANWNTCPKNLAGYDAVAEELTTLMEITR